MAGSVLDIKEGNMRGKPKLGERVQYAHTWLRDVNAGYELGQRIGTVINVIRQIGKAYYVKVRWDDTPDELTGCLSNVLRGLDFDSTE